MKKIGIDMGNHSVKTSTGIEFEARVEVAGAIESGKGIKVKIDNVSYDVGKGQFDSNDNKAEKTHFKQLLSTSIALSTDSRDVSLVLGLPTNYYNLYKDSYIDKLKENKYLEFEITKESGIKENRTVLIREAKIVPEGVGAFYYLSSVPEISELIARDASFLVVDIGGITMDSFYIDSKVRVSEESSVELGMIRFYEKLASEIKSKYPKYNMGVDGISDIIKNNFVYKSFSGLEIELPFIETRLKEKALEIFNFIRGAYKFYDDYKIIICGGGAGVLNKYLKEHFTRAYITSDRFVNAKGFEILANSSKNSITLIEDWEVEEILKNKGKVADQNA